MRVLVTGSAGFIGFHLCRKLLDAGHFVDGFDGMTAYYDVALKRRRHEILARSNGFRAHLAMLEDMDALERCVATAQPDVVVHLAAQAGVRYSLENPRAYVSSNLVGTFNLLEAVRNGLSSPPHLMLASTSSVYGANTVMPFAEDQRTDHPLTLYAATKKGTEEMAHSWSHLWGTPTTIFRFFTVYGPWGRPDMAMFKFVEAILNERPIEIYNGGDMKRDFTYVDDLVDAIIRLAAVPPGPTPTAEWDLSHSPVAPFRVVNIGRGAPVSLLAFVDEIERCLGRKAIRDYRPMQPGDVPETFADCTLLEKLTGFKPSTDLRTGVAHFVDWYMGWRADAVQAAQAVPAA